GSSSNRSLVDASPPYGKDVVTKDGPQGRCPTASPASSRTRWGIAMHARSRRLAAGIASLTALGLVAACGSGGDDGGGDGDAVTLTITANAISGGKNAAEADWIRDWVIPQFEAAQAEAGCDVTVEFLEEGVDDEDYKTKIVLDLQAGEGADIIGIDGIWV